MSFDTLQKSTYEYLIDRKFVDPEIVSLYQSSCQFDPQSAGCRFFEIEFDKGVDELNPYSTPPMIQTSTDTATTTIPSKPPQKTPANSSAPNRASSTG
jgi:hypothetical protein